MICDARDFSFIVSVPFVYDIKRVKIKNRRDLFQRPRLTLYRRFSQNLLNMDAAKVLPKHSPLGSP